MTDRALDDLARRVMLDAARQEYGSLTEGLPAMAAAYWMKSCRAMRIT